MYDKSPNIAALMSSRICHDLASPIGAISNGLELLELSGISHTPEMALLNDSVEAANARLQLLRIAFGPATKGIMVAAVTLQQVLTDYYAGKKIQMNLDYRQEILRGEAKLLLLLVLCIETALPYGGEVHIDKLGDNWRLVANGRVKQNMQCWQSINGAQSNNDLAPSQVQFALAGMAAAELGTAITVTETASELQISLS